MNANNWVCPTCGAVNPAPMDRRANVSCGRCSGSFDVDYSAPAEPAPQQVVLVEKTAKHYKRQQLWCYTLILLSFGGCVGSSVVESYWILGGSFFLFLFAGVWLLSVRASIWWNHG